MALLNLNKIQILTYGLPLLVILTAVGIAWSPLLKDHPELATAITYDLTLTAPLLFLLLSKKSRVSKFKTVPFFIGGTIIASYVLPESGQYHLGLIKAYAIPLVELIVLTILTFNIWKAIRVFKSHTYNSTDVLTICKSSAIALFGKSRFASFFSSEIGMLYYALISWKKKKSAPDTFTNYKENAGIALAGALLMVIFIETVAFHVLLAKWSITAAWILTATSIYTAIVIFAHIKALLQRPCLLTDTQLVLRNGLIADINIDLAEIDRIEMYTKQLKSDTLKVGNLGLSKESTNHNLALYFKKPQTIEKMYGFAETCDVVLFHMDNRKMFADSVCTAVKKIDN